jgi:putative hydrolase of the HAD superfamily
MSAVCKALVLDFGGVISRTVFETHAANERVLNLPPGTLTWRGPFDPTGDALWTAMQRGEITEREYWYRRARETGRLVGEEWTELPQFLQRIRGNDPQSAIRPEALAVIELARGAGRKLAILSNELDLFYGPEFRVKLPFLALFDSIVDATYTKVLKPDPRAYRLVLEDLDLPPEQCVFVDDQPKNILGADLVGMKTVQFDVTDPAASFARAVRLLGIDMKEPIRAER